MHRSLEQRLRALEAQEQPEEGGYVVDIGDDPDQLVTVNGVDITLAEFERRYPDARAIDIGGPTHGTR